MRISGSDALQTELDRKPPNPDATTYTPVLMMLAVVALMSLALSWVAYSRDQPC